MVALNFDRGRPEAMLNLNEVAELRGWSRDNGGLRLGAGLTYAEIEHGELRDVLPALAEASRTVGSPQIRNRGTIGGNLGTASPAGDALPPLLVEGAEVECASVRGTRRVPLADFVTGVKRNALEPDELITAVHLVPSSAPQTFMKIGPRNAMVIAVVSLALSGGDELRASFGSASPRPRARDRPARRGGVVPGAGRRRGVADRRRAWQRGLPQARAARAHASGARAGAGMRIAVRVNGEEREADCWEGRVAALRAAREARLPRLEERVRAGRVRIVLGAPRRHARLRVPRARRAGGRARGDDGRGAGGRRATCTRSSRRSSMRARCSAASARRGSSSRPPSCCAATPRRPTTRSARRSRATSAVAPATQKIFDAVRSPRARA